jgi:hypothetical protein
MIALNAGGALVLAGGAAIAASFVLRLVAALKDASKGEASFAERVEDAGLATSYVSVALVTATELLKNATLDATLAVVAGCTLGLAASAVMLGTAVAIKRHHACTKGQVQPNR